MGQRRTMWSRGMAPAVVAIGVILATSASEAQIPGLPGAGTPIAGSGAPKPAPTTDNPKAKVATSTGKIAVREPVSDRAMQRTLEGLLERYPGVRKVGVSVKEGFVTLDGQVDDDETHDEITDFVRRVEGVRLVLNLMKTDDEVMTGIELARRELSSIETFFARKWLLMLVALGAILSSAALARLFARYSETLLAPFVRNALLRSVIGSLLSGLIVICGLLMAVSALRLTQVVLSILGLAGVVGLAVGFAFKDITENFIASVLLGVRRPFRVGDWVRVAGQEGAVLSLNTRATVLVTDEGKHVRISNATIYKEILVNSSAGTRTRAGFDVLIPYEASTSEALDAMTRALQSQDGILPDPSPRALVSAAGARRGSPPRDVLDADLGRGRRQAPERRQDQGQGRLAAGRGAGHRASVGLADGRPGRPRRRGPGRGGPRQPPPRRPRRRQRRPRRRRPLLPPGPRPPHRRHPRRRRGRQPPERPPRFRRRAVGVMARRR